MKLSEVKSVLPTLTEVLFQLPSGEFVSSHFHVTEVGMITKNFIDCGGTTREEKVVSFQLWEANDYEHRLAPGKLLNIIEMSERVLGLGDFDIEVEYQGSTIGKYGLSFNGQYFLLTTKLTDCLAKDKCGISQEKLKVKLSDLTSSTSACNPRGGCC
ncbi:MAG: DUF6428 family protein [Flavobacteriales bacterium]